MEIEQVEPLMLEPFNLHTDEPICSHSPSDYLSTNFRFYPSDHDEESGTAKNDNDVDALWTKAVDNMFKSSRLFNGSIMDEEKENIAENVMDNITAVETVEKEQEKGAEQAKPDGQFAIESVKAEDLKCTLPNDSSGTKPQSEPTAVASDQIVPTSVKPLRKKSAKRKLQDCDVNFDLIVSSSLPPSFRYENKRFKQETPNNTEVATDSDIQDGWSIPPKNCIAVAYNFDAAARLPSFREAFVPAIKKISSKVKELKRKRRTRYDSMDKQVVLDMGHPKKETTPVHRHSYRELENQGIQDSTGGALLGSNAHPAGLLSEFNEVEQFKVANKSHENGNFNNSGSPGRGISELGVPYQSEIKQEKIDNFSQCAKPHHDNNITETPSKFLGLNSANLKDIEKDIFSFDEGLEMLDLDKDFSIPNIANQSLLDTASCSMRNGLSNPDTDWSFGLSDVPDVHGIADKRTFGGHFIPVEKHLSSHNLAMDDKASDMIKRSGLSDLPLTSSTQSHCLTPFIQSRPLNGMDMINIDPSGMHINMDILKQECSSQPADHGNFDILGQVQQQLQQNELQEANHNNMNAMFSKDFPPELKIGNSNQPNFRNSNSIDGQIIAQQIHQSFGADIFGSPGDNGAKILAKYLAQRGSVRPGDAKPKINVTSAIASLIGKSFDEQEASHKISRDNNNVDFISPSDLEHLDFMNDQF